MERNEIVKSEIGAEAAWRGFSTQTLYSKTSFDSRKFRRCLKFQVMVHFINARSGKRESNIPQPRINPAFH